MRNLNTYNGNTSVFLDEVIVCKRNSCKDPDFKRRVNVLASGVKVLYDNYEIVHNTNDHVSLVPYGYVDQDKADLLKLYSPDNSMLVKLKNSVTTVFDNRAMNTCQYCTIAPVSSLDHIVPKDEFPEFSVNPKNLLPACTICNSYKSRNWRDSNKTIFLNLYTDTLPTSQYLFVDLDISGNNIQPTFELRNTNNVETRTFELLMSHYTKLHLPERFKRASHSIISELTNLIISSNRFLSQSNIIDLVKDKIREDKFLFGDNYYKSILEEALVDNRLYMDSVVI